ncbi:related to tetrahydrofolylpolyglutamate synthase [Sporisorium reilianum SRZ2]|uniref:Related to tetrahydrofolylpolyglutamate synthase n=1 Tax=Sporisorium reilianum (strain SRZ2) TaxID=999809 RepID=E6ZWB2_SPORE|nr:related to tetrahydrofolylpolyglutamate synthase [Sporisorium reilianum SRZ2]
MPSADPRKALPGGGPASLITLKTHPPLPSFSIPHRVPDPSSDVSSFKLSILRILTGQTNAQSSTKPLTFSEEVKEKAINGWRMQMLTLELRQKDDLEDQDHDDEAQPDGDDAEMRGFELQDHHECSLIEEGDMIVVRLKPGHTLQELELPKLSSDHRYSAPAGSLTRAGTLSEPPPYSIIQPSEPSSFSSSVGAQPNANYHQHRYQDYRSAFRVVTANNVGSGHVRRSTATNTAYAGNPAALGQGLNLLQSGKGSGNKGKRRSSSSAALPKASASPKLGSTAVLPSTAATGVTGASATSANPSTVALAASTIDQQNVASPPTSPRLGSGAPTPVSASGAPDAPLRRHSSSVVTVQAVQRSTAAPAAAASSSSPNPNGKSSAQFPAMPATALVIGPGVQGQVGRNPASVASPIGSYGGAEIGEYGNAKGLVGFTSAGGSDFKAKPRRRPSKQNSQEHISANTDSNVLDTSASRRRPSNPASAAADAAERRAALARQSSAEAAGSGAVDAATRRPAKERQTSSSSRINKTELPTPPVLPPIQNLAPFPEFEAAAMPSSSKPRKERDLPAMPMAADEPEMSKSMVAVSAPTESKPPRLSFLRKFSSNTQASRNTDSGADSPAHESARGGALGFTRQPQTTSVPLEEMDPAIKPALDGEASQNNSLSRAERRYLEVQKALAVEREKQAEAEKLRADEIRASQARKEKERERKESEAKKRAEEQKWEMWEEVRRQKSGNAANTPVPPAIQRLYSGATNESGGASSKAVGKPAMSPAAVESGHDSSATAAVALPAAASSATNGAQSGSASQPPVPRAVPSSSNGNAHGNGNDSGMGQRIELGLERITRLLARLGSPHKRFPVIHVAGTNGKGSTIAYLDSILRNALDIRTGTFVSPHLIERRDCCKVDGDVVAKDVWRQAQSDVLFADQGLEISATANDDGQPLKSSPFELLTAQMFQAFSLLPETGRPEVLLVEVGLGGRLDATNVFDDSQVLASLICPIDRDHEAFLGSKLEGIAREKAGIVKENGLCIIADQRLEDSSTVDQLALGPLENEAKQLGARAAGILDSVRNVCMARNARLVKTYIPWKLLSLPPTKSERWGSSIDFTPRLAPTLFLSTSGLNPPSTFVAHPHDPVVFSVPVSVERTRANLTGVCLAVQALSSIARDEWAHDRWEELRTRIMWGLRDDAEANVRVRESINAVQWAGRCSWHRVDGVDVLVDGAHNESSAVALRGYVDGCLAARALSDPVAEGAKGKAKSASQMRQYEVTYIFAFSEGKDYEAMVHALLGQPGQLVERQNVALTTFSPPEGMPWVRSVELADSLATLKRVAQTVDVGELRTFDSVDGAMEWAKRAKGPVVVAGSLYLVADTYRWLMKKGVWSQ